MLVDRWRHHRRRRRPRRRLPGAAHRARGTRRLRVRHVVEVLEAGARRPPLPPAARVRPRLREPARAPDRALRNAPHLVRPLPFLLPIFTRDGLISRRLARALGSAMWMYDLTGGLRIGKRHKQISKAEALAHMPTLRAERSRARTSTTTRRPTTPASRSRSPAPPPRTARPSPTTRRSPGSARTTTVASTSATVRADGETFEVRVRSVVNAAGVWADDVRALDEGTHPDSIRPAKGIHITVPWSKVRNDIAVVVPVPKDRRSVFVVPWGDLTYVGTTDTDYDGPLDDPQCTPDDVAYLLAAMNLVHARSSSRRPTSSGRGPGCARSCARRSSERTADLSRRHAVRRSDSGVVTITGGKLTTYRQHGRGHDRRGESRSSAPDPQPHEEAAAGRRRGLHPAAGERGTECARPPRPPLRHRGVGGARARRRRRRPGRARSCPACPTCGPKPSTRCGRRWRARSTTCSSRRTRARLLARDASAAVAADVARLLGTDLGWDEAEQARQVEGVPRLDRG